jgi:two-component system, NtrC family, nitrogen regulation response regulator NtrX
MATLAALIIDDEAAICESLGGVVADEGWRVESASNGLDGIKKLRINEYDLVFLDVWMKGIDGVETLQRIRDFNLDIPVVVMSGHGSIETAVRVTKLGAFEFLEKPLSVEKILPLLELARVSRDKKTGAHTPAAAGVELLGECESMKKMKAQINLVASKNTWVLITGENGTGKEVVARSLHHRSSRADKPFVAVNCAAIPEDLIESELFGHVKGAFTGAIANKKGKFEQAHQGTMFLDEIGDMSLRTQAKVLRILQEQSFERVGDHKTIEVDVRVIAATNKELKEEIEQGNFREDLYYRLNVIPFHLTPLRNRGADILLLASHFLKQVAINFGEQPKRLSEEVKRAFLDHNWSGNVRELSNLVERLVVLSRGEEVLIGDLPSQFLEQGGQGAEYSAALFSSTLKQARSEFEKVFILDKLNENQWNVSKTADAIGIERSNLHRKLKSLEIDTKKLKN